MNRSLRLAFFAFTFVAALSACEERRATQPSAPLAAQPSTPLSTPAAARRPTGGVDGRIRLEGTRPAPARVPTNDSVARHCGADVEDRSLVVAKDGGVAFAVASIDDVPASSEDDDASAAVTTIDNHGCLFAPAILGARAGGTIAMKNSDPLTHSVRANANGRDLYNVALPLEGMVTRKPLPRQPGIVRLVCDIHPWMNARIKTFAHPHFATADAEGRFHLDGIPAGRHTLTVWHPRLGERSVEIEVKEGAAANAEVRFTTADIRPPE